MPEWVLVVSAGALGALVTDYYQQRGHHHGLTRPGFAMPSFFTDDDGVRRFDPGVLASLCIGCVAAVITILSVNASLLASPTADWNSALGALLAGIASDAFLRRIIREAQQQAQNKRRLEDIGAVMDTLVPDTETPTAPDDAGTQAPLPAPAPPNQGLGENNRRQAQRRQGRGSRHR